MSGPVRQLRRVMPAAARLVVLLAALAGLFAMHGLSDHGTAGPAEMAMADSMHVTHEAVAIDDSTATVGSVHAAPKGDTPHHDMGLMGLCLAVAAAVFALAIALLRLQVSRVRALMPAMRSSLLASARERVPRPPDLFALSIQRC